MSEEKKTVEAWAQEKGHVSVAVRVGKATVTKPSPKAWVFKAAKALERWPVGRELTESEYDAACERAAEMKVGR